MPAAAQPIDPAGEMTLPAMEMPELMRHYRGQFAAIQRMQQGQPQDQVVALAPQAKPLRDIGRSGVEFSVDDDAMQRRGAHGIAYALYLGT